MMTIQLDMYQACALGALVYCLGRFMVKKLGFLSKYCIPAPVAGGIVFALLHLALYGAGVLEFSFDTTIQTILMTVFFCSVGFTACFRLLKKGGIQVFIFLALSVGMCIIQDAVGSGIWFGSAFRSLYGIHAAGRRTWHFRFFRASSGRDLWRIRSAYGRAGSSYIWPCIRKYDGRPDCKGAC